MNKIVDENKLNIEPEDIIFDDFGTFLVDELKKAKIKKGPETNNDVDDD